MVTVEDGREGNFTIEIVHALPPNIEEIKTKFDVVGKPIFFAYGDKIYNPMGIRIPTPLLAHEAVHMSRQMISGVEAWWREYLDDPEFRLDEELLAHRAEYQHYRKLHGAGNRTQKYLDLVAERLASPLYGSLRPKAELRHSILAG